MTQAAPDHLVVQVGKILGDVASPPSAAAIDELTEALSSLAVILRDGKSDLMSSKQSAIDPSRDFPDLPAGLSVTSSSQQPSQSARIWNPRAGPRAGAGWEGSSESWCRQW